VRKLSFLARLDRATEITEIEVTGNQRSGAAQYPDTFCLISSDFNRLKL
jgi:hypothetical protein